MSLLAWTWLLTWGNLAPDRKRSYMIGFQYMTPTWRDLRKWPPVVLLNVAIFCLGLAKIVQSITDDSLVSLRYLLAYTFALHSVCTGIIVVLMLEDNQYRYANGLLRRYYHERFPPVAECLVCKDEMAEVEGLVELQCYTDQEEATHPNYILNRHTYHQWCIERVWLEGERMAAEDGRLYTPICPHCQQQPKAFFCRPSLPPHGFWSRQQFLWLLVQYLERFYYYTTMNPLGSPIRAFLPSRRPPSESQQRYYRAGRDWNFWLSTLYTLTAHCIWLVVNVICLYYLLGAVTLSPTFALNAILTIVPLCLHMRFAADLIAQMCTRHTATVIMAMLHKAFRICLRDFIYGKPDTTPQERRRQLYEAIRLLSGTYYDMFSPYVFRFVAVELGAQLTHYIVQVYIEAW